MNKKIRKSYPNDDDDQNVGSNSDSDEIDSDSSGDDDQLDDFDDETDLDWENMFTFVYSIQDSSADIGKITDCKIIESKSQNGISTLAFCTSLGFIKIFNINTKYELFSLKLTVPSTQNSKSKLNKLFYKLDYIITIDSSGYIYFIDLQKQADSFGATSSNGELVRSVSFSSSTKRDSSSSLATSAKFLSHTIRLTSNCLNCLSIYKESIVCTGDSEGNLYFLSLIDF
jgi:hypothetical protein